MINKSSGLAIAPYVIIVKLRVPFNWVVSIVCQRELRNKCNSSKVNRNEVTANIVPSQLQ